LGGDIDGLASGDQSGKSVAISADGNTVLIGSPYHKVGAKANTGLCRVYRFNGTDWNQLGSDIIGSSSSYKAEYFGSSVALSADGDVLAIGAPYFGTSASCSSCGRVQVYDWNGNSWSQVGNDIVGTYAADYLGQSIALSSSGNILAVGSPGHGGGNYGTVRVYSWDGVDNWARLGSDIDGDDKYSLSGTSLAISSYGATLAVGSPGSDNDGMRSGSVQVYIFNGTTWNRYGNRLNGTSVADEFGCSVSLSSDGKTLAVGAQHSGSMSGRAAVYGLHEDNWTQIGDAFEGAPFDRVGSSVSLSGDGKTIALGFPYSNANGSSSGHVGVYQWDGSWVLVGNQIAGESTNDHSGTSVSLTPDGSKVAIGAVGNDGVNGTDSGHVRIFKLSTTQSPVSFSTCLLCIGKYFCLTNVFFLAAPYFTTFIATYGNKSKLLASNWAGY
jgi:hypothetical protein